MAKPVATLSAVLTESYDDANGKSVEKSHFVPICDLFETKSTDSNSLTGTIRSEPIQWRNPAYPRRVVVAFRGER